MKTFEVGNLVIQYRKSALLINLKNPLTKSNTKGFRAKPEDPYYFKVNSLDRSEKVDMLWLLNKLKEVGSESWVNLEPKECDSFGSDYRENYLKEFDNEASTCYKNGMWHVSGYHQPYHEKDLVLIYKFNKRKFESFIYDLEKMVDGNE